MMTIRDIMTRPVERATPDDTIHAAAAKMVAMDCGILPVGENDRLVGIVSLGDLATTKGTSRQAQKALGGISEPGPAAPRPRCSQGD